MNTEQLVTVLRTACMIEDRDAIEQRAMLDVAHHLDQQRAGSGYSKPRPPELLALVRATYEPSAGRRIEPTTQQLAQQARLIAMWQPCNDCGHPMGWHYLHNACPSTPLHLAQLAEIHERLGAERAELNERLGVQP